MLLLLGAALAADTTFEGAVSASYWRLGFNLLARPGLSIDMPWRQEGSVLFGEAALKPQAELYASPAFAKVGGRLRFEPVAVLDVTPYAYGIQYFGNFQTVIGYDDWDALYGDNDAIAAYVDEDPERQATGRGLILGGNGTLKAKAGPAIVMVNGDLSRWWVNSVVAQEYDYFLEREAEVLMRMGPQGGDTLLQVNGALLYELDRDVEDGKFLRVGSLTTWRRTFTADDELLRTGLIMMATTGNYTHVVLAQPYLRDRAFDTAVPPFVAYQFRVSM